jgi:hypothetical protein
VPPVATDGDGADVDTAVVATLAADGGVGDGLVTVVAHAVVNAMTAAITCRMRSG